ncbi:ABC transport system, sugar-binding protein [Paenibacillus pasadenensis]|uniref:ABC transport system, sugar-binding protein n=1 Tax=Paenibacillus pasadenensis TaxID=217090 RepID=A0A2N5N9L7_9BACL|nr:extracellular solute-binding protein [Paenibacillus pasadenensis]PLT47022.1 ABC transport system, sugar-binding protein [Paenibacillus pasadenensis]
MKSKKSLLAISALMVAVGLSACTNNGNGGNNAGSNASESGSVSSASPAPSASASKPVEIKVLTEGSVNVGTGVLNDSLLETKKKALIADETVSPRVQASDFSYVKGQSYKSSLYAYFYQNIIKDKMAEKNISVNMEDWGWGETLTQKETAGFLAGNIPDVIVGETQMPGFAMQGLLEPFPDDMAEEIRENIAPAAWKPMEVGGKIYGFAAQPGVSSLFWNKALVKEAGIDPDKAPESWDELLSNINKVTEAGKGKFYGGGVYAGPNAGGYLRYGPLLVINNGGFIDAEGNPAFNSDANIKTVEFLRSLYANHPAGLMVSPEEGPYFDAFKKQQTAYIIDGPWRASESVALGIDYGMAPIPLSEGGQAGNITIGAAFNAVPKNAKNKEAAFEYIRALYSDEIQNLIADGDLRSPVKKSVAETAEYQAAHPAMYLHYQAMSGNVQGLPTFKNNDSKVWQLFGDAITKAVMSNGDIKATLDDAQERADKEIGK